MEKLIVDRITEGVAVLEKEDRSHTAVPLSDIGLEIKEGSVLLFDGEKYIADSDEEDERRKRIFAMQERLRKRQ